MSSFFNQKRIMIVAAHHDDELLGLGASMNFLIRNHNVCSHVIILGEGLTGRSETRDTDIWREELKIQKKDAAKAKDEIGYHTMNFYDLPDNRFDTIPLLDIVKIIEKEKQIYLPDIVFVHHGGDLNIDHQRTFQAVITATRPMQGETVKSIFCFETPSVTEWRSTSDPFTFTANFFIPFLKDNLEAKLRGMESYRYEKRKFPHPRSPEALEITARKWGITIGCEYAEAFYLVRNIFS
jgi:LmbE family N-acetylglucosaminyl deacetylase